MCLVSALDYPGPREFKLLAPGSTVASSGLSLRWRSTLHVVATPRFDSYFPLVLVSGETTTMRILGEFDPRVVYSCTLGGAAPVTPKLRDHYRAKATEHYRTARWKAGQFVRAAAVRCKSMFHRNLQL